MFLHHSNNDAKTLMSLIGVALITNLDLQVYIHSPQGRKTHSTMGAIFNREINAPSKQMEPKLGMAQ